MVKPEVILISEDILNPKNLERGILFLIKNFYLEGELLSLIVNITTT